MQTPVSFEAFFRAVHGNEPFPWQSRLARVVMAEGWPSEIGIPTGLGKTSAIDVAIWALAAQAGLPPSERSAPTRIWYVVNRRLLVDAASEHAWRLARMIADPDGTADIFGGRAGRRTIQWVGSALRAIGGVEGQPLFVRRLRGGVTERRRPVHAAQPAIICATVPMYGSRLLFRGYGETRSMWPIEAALAGTDSLVLLDEAHLARPLQRLVEVARECDAVRTGVLRPSGRFLAQPERLLPEGRTGPVLVSLTATGVDAEDRFDLDAKDRAHPVVGQRLYASKPTELVEVDAKKLAPKVAEEMLRLVGVASAPGAAVAFLNAPSTARAVAAELRKVLPEGRGEILVLTGQVRDPEALGLRERLLDPATGVASSPDPVVRAKPLFVISTQTLEVGADIDFDFLVSESAGVRAVAQRLGRLNRLGVKPHARAVLVHPTGGRSTSIYGTEPDELWSRLVALPQPVDLCPERIAETLGDPTDRPPYVPELLPSHMWEFAKTAIPPSDAAPPEIFFSGLEDPDYRVSICWRVVLPDSGEEPMPPTVAAEFAEVPIGELRSFLDSRGWSSGVILDVDGRACPLEPGVVRPGAQVILAASLGGYADGWQPDSDAEVFDVSPLLGGAVFLIPDALCNSLGRPLTAEELSALETLDLGEEEEPDAVVDVAVGEMFAEMLTGSPSPAQRPLAMAIEIGDAPIVVERVGERQLPLLRWSTPAVSRRSEMSDELSLAPTTILADHLRQVAEAAGGVALSLGMTERVVESVSLGGLYHDLGKADPRFQRWLGADRELLAKSNAPRSRWESLRERSGWPRGGRHELLGLQLLEAVEMPRADADLVAHLVAAHHGWGRPLVPATELAHPIDIGFEVLGLALAAQLDPGEWRWEQPDRFRRLCERYGYWGLALLEALVRQADHQVSAAEVG